VFVCHTFIMQIKRGRPKKVVLSQEDTDRFFESIDNPPEPNEELKAANEKYKKTVKKPGKVWGGKELGVGHVTDGSLGKNRIYRNKDGTSCLVTYSGNKNPPEEIHFK